MFGAKMGVLTRSVAELNAWRAYLSCRVIVGNHEDRRVRLVRNRPSGVDPGSGSRAEPGDAGTYPA